MPAALGEIANLVTPPKGSPSAPRIEAGETIMTWRTPKRFINPAANGQ